MALETANNCWPANLEKFSQALANSDEFQTLTETANETLAAGKIFGKRLTHTKNGQAWTADELADLHYYGMVYSHPEQPFGYTLINNAHYESHGVVCVAMGRLVPTANLEDPTDERTGLTDEHDREWQNIVGTIITEMLSWLQENAGPYPIPAIEITDDHENKAENAPTQGVWQYTEVSFQYGQAQ